MFQIIQVFVRQMVRNPPATLRVLILLAVVLLYGTTGFLYFELPGNPDLGWLDGLWYTLVTMTTVGYGDFFPRSTGGRFLVGWPVMIFGIGLLGYALSVVAAALITFKSREIKGMTSFDFKDHLVIFNYPSLAKIERIIEELRLDPAFDNTTPIVLVDETLDMLPPELLKLGVHYVRGNPARDGTLVRASIDRVRHAVVLCRNPSDPGSDNLNLAIVLAIEGRNQNVNTVVECVDQASEELLKKAGCDRIVCTSRFDAHFLSQELLNPGVQEVIDDLLSAREGQQIYISSIREATTFDEVAGRCREEGHLAIGICTPDGPRMNVGGETPLTNRDRVITIGPHRLESL
ncbi:MAG: potassium channel protein [Syntrophobacteraceae bacterium]|nr:potassium channel protein [Syntrophobacteraceae bacterium]